MQARTLALQSSYLIDMSTQIQAVIITVSDACAAGERKDESGEALVELLTALDAHIVAKVIVNDDLEPLAHKLRAYTDLKHVNLIVTTGGTGFGPRDNTPEATLRVIEREAPGLVEAMRVQTFKSTPMAMISPCGCCRCSYRQSLPKPPMLLQDRLRPTPLNQPLKEFKSEITNGAFGAACLSIRRR